MRAVIAGRDEDGFGNALDAEGATVVRIDGLATRDALETAGIEEADAFVITDPMQATAIPVAREVNDDLRIVVYAEESLPEFAQPLADLIVDPELLDSEAVAEELAA